MRTKDYSNDIKNGFYLGLGIIILYNLNDIIKGIKGAITPDAPTANEKENIAISKGKFPLTKKGNGANLKRFDTDSALAQRVAKLKSGIENNDQSMIQNALIPVKSDADFAKMSDLFGEEFSLLFTRGSVGFYNMSEALQEYATAYTKARINQSWSNNKKYPTQITFKL